MKLDGYRLENCFIYITERGNPAPWRTLSTATHRLALSTCPLPLQPPARRVVRLWEAQLASVKLKLSHKPA